MDSALAFVLRRVPAFRGLDEAKQMCTVAILRYISIVGLLAASSASMLQGLYFVVVTGTTIGYGDLVPTTTGARLYTIFLIFLLLYLLTAIVDAVTQIQNVLIEALHRKKAECAHAAGAGGGRDEAAAPPVLAPVLVAERSGEEPPPLDEELLEDTVEVSSQGIKWCFVLMVVELLGGGVMFAAIEGWSIPEGIWYCFITLTTIGRGIFIPYALVGLGTMAYLVTSYAGRFAEKVQQGTLTWIAVWEDHLSVPSDPRLAHLVPQRTPHQLPPGCWQRFCATMKRGGVTALAAAFFLLLLRRIPAFRRRTVESQAVVGQLVQFFVLVWVASGSFLTWGLEEQLNYQDLQYFDMVTCTTVGYGDITPPRYNRLGMVVITFIQLATASSFIEAIAVRQQKSMEVFTEAIQRRSMDMRKQTRSREPMFSAAQSDSISAEGATTKAGLAPLEVAHPTPPGAGETANPAAVDLSVATFQLKVLAVVLAVYVVGGGVMFARLEGWSIVDGIYFATVTASTVGYGDFAPTRPVSRSVWPLYALIGVAAISVFLAALQAKAQARRDYTRLYRLERALGMSGASSRGAPAGVSNNATKGAAQHNPAAAVSV